MGRGVCAVPKRQRANRARDTQRDFGFPGRCRTGRSLGRGSSLIEVLVSILILSFGLFAMGALQGYAIAGSQTSGYRLQASLLAIDAAEVLRGQPGVLEAARGRDGVDSAVDDDTAQRPCRYPACTAQALAALELDRLRHRARAELPEGNLLIAAPASGGAGADIWVGWQEPRFHAPSAGGDGHLAEKDFDDCPAAWRAAARMPRCLRLRVGA